MQSVPADKAIRHDIRATFVIDDRRVDNVTSTQMHARRSIQLYGSQTSRV